MWLRIRAWTVPQADAQVGDRNEAPCSSQKKA
jgi:hypothetical protein